MAASEPIASIGRNIQTIFKKSNRPVPHEGQLAFPAGFGKQLFYLCNLICRQQVAAVLVYPKLFGHVLRNAANIAREHDGLFHAYLLQLGYGRPGGGLFNIGYNYVAGVLAVYGDMYYGA